MYGALFKHIYEGMATKHILIYIHIYIYDAMMLKLYIVYIVHIPNNTHSHGIWATYAVPVEDDDVLRRAIICTTPETGHEHTLYARICIPPAGRSNTQGDASDRRFVLKMTSDPTCYA